MFAVLGFSSVRAEAQAIPDADASLRAFIQKMLTDSAGPPGSGTKFSSAQVVLKPGSDKQFIVYMTSREWCGSGGCTMLVLNRHGATFATLGRMTVAQLPVRVLKSMTNGWHDIGVAQYSMGQKREARLSFNGERYPSNPSLQLLSHGVAGKIVPLSLENARSLY